ELEIDELAGVSVVGVTAGASAPEDLVQAVIAKLDPRDGVEPVYVTDEDEYFPPPRELRELVPALDGLAALMVGGDPVEARRRRRRGRQCRHRAAGRLPRGSRSAGDLRALPGQRATRPGRQSPVLSSCRPPR